MNRNSSRDIHCWLGNLESKLIRVDSCFQAAIGLRQEAFTPDVILAHLGWGEATSLYDVCPPALIGLHYEWHFAEDRASNYFDPEFWFIEPQLAK